MASGDLKTNFLRMKTDIRDLIDITKIGTLLEGFYKTTGLVTAIIDFEGNIIIKSGMRQVCNDFHRVNPDTLKKCIVSDTELASKMMAREKYHFYKCLNGLVDVAVPIVINGAHVANLFSGQFLFEPPDIPFFKAQAKEYGFDEKKYLDAVHQIKIVSKDNVIKALDFLLDMTQLISDQAYQKVQQAELILKLQKNEQKLKAVFESANVGKSITLPTGEINVNQAFCDMLGYTREELVGKTWQDLTPEEDLPVSQAFLESLLKGEQDAVRYEKRYFCKNGSYLWVDVSVSLQRDENGAPLYFITTVIDITERKKNEEQIREGAERSKKQRNLIAQLTFEDSIVNSDVDNALIILTTKLAETLRVDRVSVWLLSENDTKLKRQMLYDIDSGFDSQVEMLNTADVPSYFKALRKDSLIDADDAQNDPRTRELNENYFIPLQISSLLDSVIQQNGRLIGVVSAEHCGPIRAWHPDEKSFLSAIANVVAQLLANAERRVAEEKLKISEARYRSVITLSNTGAWEYHQKENYLWCSPEYFKMLGRNFEDYLMDGQSNLQNTWINLLHPDDRQMAINHFSEYLESGSIEMYENFFRMSHANGSWVWIWSRGQSIPDSNGKASNYTVGTHINITERKLAELILKEKNEEIAAQNEELNQTNMELYAAKEKAEESDRLKSAFLANMSHEIRTPMNGILGFAELLKEPGLDSDKQKEFIEIIEQSGARMLNIINQIVDISKIEAGLMELEIKETNINEQIEYIYTFFRPEAEAKKINLSFKTSLPQKEATIRTDREKVYAILMNLVKNAIKYTHEGSIELGYNFKPDRQPPELEFYIKDTGIGISKRRHEAIFERFIQADIEDRMAYQGAGLGLSIAKAYVEMLGGKIWVESQEKLGSTFYFTLPYYNISETSAADIQPEPKANSGHNKSLKILVAEDDEVSEMLIESYLKIFSKEILIAKTGMEAVKLCQDNPDIDLILMDIRMPGMDGHEATRKIRGFNKEVIIIAQTALGLTVDRQKAIESGCNDYISKPINKNELTKLIQKHFRSIEKNRKST